MKTSKPHLRFPIIAILLLATGFTSCSPQAKKARQLERAERSFKAGEYDKAKIDYLAVLRVEPQNATAIQRLGLIWSESGSALAALPFLMKTRDLNPGDLVSRKKLATALVSLGDWGGAKKEVIEILRQAPSDGEVLLTLAETARTPEQLPELEQELNAFPAKNAAEYHAVAASIALRKNDQATAETELQQAVAADPKSAVAHSALGYFAMARKNIAKAIEEFKTAADLSPVRSSARIKYAEILLSTGASDQAKVLLDELTKKAPDYLPAWRLLSQAALSDKNYKDALALLDNIFSRDPQNLEARILQSNILLAQGEPKKTVELLEKLDSAYNGKIPGVKLQLANAAMADNNRAQAEIALNQAIAANPDYAEAILALADLNLRFGQTAPAVTAMTDLLKKRPDLSQTRPVLAAAFQLLGRLDDAANVLQEQIRLWPADAHSHVLLGLIFRQQNKLPEARQVLEKAQQIAPKDIGVSAQLVDLDIAEKKFDAASQRVRELREKQPDSAFAQFLEAKVFCAQEDYPATEAALQKALSLDPNLPDAYDLLVRTYLARNKLPEAAKELEAALAKHPGDSQAAMTLALVREKMKDFQGAADAYEKVLVSKADFVPALNNLAYLYAEYLNQPQKAVEIARKARTAQPADPSVADTLGWALFKQQDYPQALALLQESAAKLTTSPVVQFHLGMARYMMGEPEAAKTAFEQALTAPAEFVGKEEAQRRLALLNSGAGQEALSREVLEKLLAEQPADIVGWMRLGGMYEAENNLPKAAEAYERARQLNPNLLAANHKLAQFNAGFLENKEKAIELARKSRELAPNDPAVAGTLGAIVLRAGNYQWAYSLLQEAARGKSDDPGVPYELGMAAYALGKVDEARQAVQRVLELAPASARAADAKRFLNLTALEPSSPELSAAEPEINKILQTEPDFVPALMVRGALQFDHNDPDGAIRTYTDVLHRYRDFAPAQKRLAAIYVSRPADLAKADEMGASARRALPNDSELNRILGEIKFKKKDYPAARRLLQESAQQAPLDPSGLYYLGAAQIETTEDEKGRETLQRALDAGLKDPLAEEARRRLRPKE